jgi:putative ergosteryl-3beta-O-L-aspartate hydrolase
MPPNESYKPPTSTEKRRPRWMLHVQAQFWRVLMSIGMYLHRFAPPRPPPPNFTRTISTTVSPTPGKISLLFYVPPEYSKHRRQRNRRYPVVINFHGGGFTLGSATDDARWCKTVVDECNAVVVAVDYRRAPEHPFPTAVEDGVDAVKYIAAHADELCLDPDRIALSGFSSGGNMAFTVPLRLQAELLATPSSSQEDVSDPPPLSTATTAASMSAFATLDEEAAAKARQLALEEQQETSQQPPHPLSEQEQKAAAATLIRTNGDIRLRGIVSWYPPTDYTQTREQRRMTCARADQELPAVFTRLFDDSYLYPPTMDLASPYLSPGIAATHLLAQALPEDIVLCTVEWDMLLAEGERMRDRLVNELGKRVVYFCVPGVPHGWDKAPNPIRPTPGVQEHYAMACKELRRILRTTALGTEASRRSMSVVR